MVPFSTGIEDINMTSKKTKLKMTKRNNKAGFLFLLPLIVIFIGLLGYSFYFLISNSFRDVTITFRRSEFVGLANYQTIFKDKSFWKSLLNTFILSTANIFCGLTFGFIISIILNFKIKGKRFFHALFFIPSMLPIALMATVFGSMLEYKNGIVNQILRGVGLGALAQRWLADPKLAMGAVCSVSIFMIGIPIMYYTADLTTISRSILEAATIDGAGMKDQLLLIIFPVLKNTHKTIILSMLLGGFREMERVYLMTDGGPGGSTEIIGTYIYRATRSAGSNIGLVCAAAIIVLIVAFIISFIQLKMTSKNGEVLDMRKKKEKDYELEQDLFAISKANRRVMIIFLIIMLALWCVPIYSLLKDSLKVHGIENYWYVLTNEVNGVPFYQYFVNSIINAVFASALLVLICSFSGFAFSKIEFAGRKVIYNLVLMCLAISGPILIIPFFYIYKTAHLYNTHLAIILSECLITIPFGVLMMKNFFDGLPTELMESANVDGASIQRCFFSIYLPLAKPAIINLAVLQIMWSFQDFLFPLMFLTKDKAYTTTVAVNAFKGAYGMTPQNLGRYNAALVLISIPSILIFTFAQKFIVNGITSGAVKE